MKTFAEMELQGLKWVSAGGWGSRYELRDEDGEVLGTMRWSWWSGKVEVDASGNRWQFQRKGWWKPHVEIQSTATGDMPGRFDYRWDWTRGHLELNDGRVFVWRQTSFWQGKWAWTTEDGVPVIGFKIRSGWRISGEIFVNEEALGSAKAPSLLVFLGWYLYVTYSNDSAAGSMAGVAGG